jgi:hypothetical protein
MRVKFRKDTKDARQNRTGTFFKDQVRNVSEELGKMYIDKGYATDEDDNYLKKKKIENHGEE